MALDDVLLPKKTALKVVKSGIGYMTFGRAVGLYGARAEKKRDGGPSPHCVYDMCSIRPGTKQPCVIIIGGGVAGLSAANRLLQCGISNFKILEAMERAGGRLSSCWLGDTMTEGGWPAIEGASVANPIYTLAAQERLIEAPLNRAASQLSLIFTPEGRALDSSLLSRARSLYDDILDAASQPTQDKYKSLGERLKTTITSRVEEMPRTERWDLMRALWGLLAAERSKLGACLDKMCPTSLSELTPLPGGSVRLKGGMSALTAPLIQDLPQGTLVLCKPVRSILWGATSGEGGGPRAIVKTCDGEAFPADYVIVTVPLGVLKAQADKMFCPELPSFKMDAIKGLGFGAVNKIFLKFDKPFWGQESGDFIFSWLPDEFQEEGSWIRGVTTMSMLPGSKKVMSLTVSGDEAAAMEYVSDNQLAGDVVRLLKKFLGATVLPTPSELLRTKWSASPYFGGNKTYLPTSCGARGLVEGLRRPLPGDCGGSPPVILFAGEHAAPPPHVGTLHGSRMSGIGEAERIVRLTKELGGPPSKGPVCAPC